MRHAANEQTAAKQALERDIRSRHPHFREAVIADARITAHLRGETFEFSSGPGAVLAVIRLILSSDAFVAQVAYRAKARMQALRIPFLPRVAHWVAMTTAQVSIGDPVVMQPGVYIVHGQIVADGLIEIQSGAVLVPLRHPRPDRTRHRRADDRAGGADRERSTGARPRAGGAGARVGANAVVLEDVPDGATAVGVPARIVRS